MQGHLTAPERSRLAARNVPVGMTDWETKNLLFVTAAVVAPFIALWAMLSTIG